MESDKQELKSKNKLTISQKNLLNRMKYRFSVVMFVLGLLLGSRKLMSYEIPPFLLIIVLIIIGSAAEFLPKDWIQTSSNEDGKNDITINGFEFFKKIVYYSIFFAIGFLVGVLIR